MEAKVSLEISVFLLHQVVDVGELCISISLPFLRLSYVSFEVVLDFSYLQFKGVHPPSNLTKAPIERNSSATSWRMEACRLNWKNGSSRFPTAHHEVSATGFRWHSTRPNLRCCGVELGSIQVHLQLVPSQPHTFVLLVRMFNLYFCLLPCCGCPCMMYLHKILQLSAEEWLVHGSCTNDTRVR